MSHTALNALYIIHLQSIKETSNTYINHRKICVYKEKKITKVLYKQCMLSILDLFSCRYSSFWVVFEIRIG